MSYGPGHYFSVNRWNIYLPGVDDETWENALVLKKKAYKESGMSYKKRNVDSNKVGVPWEG